MAVRATIRRARQGLEIYRKKPLIPSVTGQADEKEAMDLVGEAVFDFGGPGRVTGRLRSTS